MPSELKPVDTYAEITRSSVDKTKAEIDLIPGADDSQKALYAEFAARDDEWRAHMDKKLLRKVDMMMLPYLILLYMLKFLDREDRWPRSRSGHDWHRLQPGYFDLLRRLPVYAATVEHAHHACASISVSWRSGHRLGRRVYLQRGSPKLSQPHRSQVDPWFRRVPFLSRRHLLDE